ncbi:membrane protein [Microtetraspora sp. NBRC 13810]|uniref:ferritin-like domain-containing protein n=1 Tax=Microtetraspora sp. NBRC 13810 TaxID=3030990 RepID=UPI0024A5744A|nr:ferritin-like domain-containing protein [Microtetraspora sp. NBRC 13810]GLW05208.1 membrane protein [Microtetraspora sp. NBRC 13810]
MTVFPADFTIWVAAFEAEAGRRRTKGDPDWARGARLGAAVAESVRRFQVGESGDGANLIDKAVRAGDDAYTAAVRLFVEEERNHARMLAELLAAAGVPTLSGHWSDAVFVRLRRALGLRLELMVLMVAEVVALRYYRALRDGGDDPLTREVAARILADEERHVPFHRHRLSVGRPPGPAGTLLTGIWWCLMAGTVTVVAVDHGKALRALGVPPARFALDALRLFAEATRPGGP